MTKETFKLGFTFAIIITNFSLSLCSNDFDDYGELKRNPPSQVEVRAVYINCQPDENLATDSETTRFERQELFMHNVLQDCYKKVAITVKMSSDSDQSLSEEYIPIDHVFEGPNKRRVRLLNPYVLRLRREAPLQAYKLRQIDTVTAVLTDTKRTITKDKLFGERSKLYRYDDKTREWKERGVGEMKILYHPERNTYRLLLRREQVHKAVLNMLIFMDLELLPMKNSDRAWTWAGRNFAETAAGEQETLAVRFKSVDLATAFHDKVVVCVRKLQAAAAQAIITSQSKHNTPPQSPGVAPLRLPKHLQDSARADAAMFFNAAGTTQAPPMSIADKQNGVSTSPAEGLKQVHFEEQPEEEVYDEYEHDYGHDEEYDDYYNEDEEESGAYYTCEGSASLKYNGMHVQCERAHVQVMFDQDVYTPKVMITDADTGEILSDNLIYTDTEFQLSGESCSWTATDYSGSEPAHKTVTVNFPDEDTAMQFYDSCETSKAATYSSTES